MLNRSSQATGATLFSKILFSTALVFLATTASADWQNGLDHFKAGNLAEAEADFRQVAETQPDWYGGHRMLGRVLLQADRWPEAVKSLARAHELAPEDSGTRFDLGRAAVTAEQPKVALAALRGERPKDIPDAVWLDWLKYRAEAHRLAGSRAEGHQDLTKLAVLEPKNADIQYRLSLSSRDLGDARGELTHLDRAVKLAPQEASYLRRSIQLRLEAMGTGPVADKCLALTQRAEKLVALEGSIPNFNLAAQVESCAGRPANAVAWHERSIKAGDDSWQTAFDLARRQTAAGAPEPAVKGLQQLLGRSEGAQKKQVHEQLGLALELLSRYSEAISQYELAGADDRLAAAKEAHAIHQTNQEEEERYRRELELRTELDKLKEMEKQAANGL